MRATQLTASKLRLHGNGTDPGKAGVCLRYGLDEYGLGLGESESATYSVVEAFSRHQVRATE